MPLPLPEIVKRREALTLRQPPLLVQLVELRLQARLLRSGLAHLESCGLPDQAGGGREHR